MINYYTMDKLDEYLSLFSITKYVRHSKKKRSYYNIPVTFDIESTNAYIDHVTGECIEARQIVKMKENDSKKFDALRYEKVSFMYVWQMSIDDKLFLGRTWKEFLDFIEAIRKKFNLSNKRYLIIYVRNLEFEFQFIKKMFKWDNVFATDPHKVLYARTIDGLEFKCSYFLAGCSLETTGKNLVKYKAEKQTGKLDYNKIRHSNTPLTNDEISYCLYDVIVDSNFIRESMENEKDSNILRIPYTKTGYVRRYVKEHVLDRMCKLEYQKTVFKFTMDLDKYAQLKRCFMGGFTHSSALNTGVTFENVHSQDFTSSYPACLLLEKYPMNKGRRYKPKSYDDFIQKTKTYCCIFDISFINLRMKDGVIENIISESKCFKKENIIVNNGRIVEADIISITLTEIDFECICQFYDFDKIKISNMWIYEKGYLPKQLLECVLHFYKGKTELKDVDGKEIEYQILKGMLNAIYGMMVTDPIRPLIEFVNDTFTVSYENMQEAIDVYNTKYDRFLVYEWGLYCTAYARRNLFTAVKELGIDFIYADTDSVKYLNHQKHKEYFENYNKLIEQKIKLVCKEYEFDEKDFSPYTIKGEKKTIGVWDKEPVYLKFKTLGAKRYAYETAEKGVNITVAGLNKKVAVPFIKDLAKTKNMSFFDCFNDELFVDGEHSGKLLHTYIDDVKNFFVTDYLGEKLEVTSLSSVHLEPSSYSLSLPNLYKMYINHIRQKYKKGDLF